MTPEQRFKRRIRNALILAGWDVQPIETSTGRGVPDLTVGHHQCGEIWLETKYGSATPKMRPEQNAWLVRGATHGRRVAVCWGWDSAPLNFYLRAYSPYAVPWLLSGDNLDTLLREYTTRYA